MTGSIYISVCLFFSKKSPEHSKVSKFCTFICLYCAKYLMFDLKKYRGVIFYDNEEWCTIWRKTDLGFGNDMSNMAIICVFMLYVYLQLFVAFINK